MPTNSDADKLFENNEPQDNRSKWNEMSERALKCPGITVFEQWLEDSLDVLEKEFSSFSTEKSMRRNFGR